MAKLTIAPAAAQDLQEIVDYITQDKPVAARRWLARIKEKCRLLAKTPAIGERRPEFLSGKCRCSLVGSYVIFYRPIEGGVEVVRVIRGDRDIQQLSMTFQGRSHGL
jgi:toxin ParE1/3/4